VEGWWAVSYLVLWCLVIMLCIVIVALARQIGTLHLRLGPRGALEMDAEGPPLGEAPQPFDVRDVEGGPISVGGPGQGQLLLFVSPGCHICHQVMPGIPAAAAAGSFAPHVITDVDRADTQAAFAGKRSSSAPLIPGPEIVRTYGIPGTPYVVVLDDRGIVRAKGTVNNLEQLEGLVDTAVRRTEEADAERRAS
jgi:methylamine dehydrogenase accessory protein MauD